MHPVIGNIEIDISSLLSIAHSCDPSLCSAKSCCSSFQVCIERSEIENLIGFMPMASDYSNSLTEGNSLGNVFEELTSDLYSIDTDESGLCVFAFDNGQKGILCSLHATAMKMNHNPEDVKPKDCVLWPLALSEDKPLTLTIDDDAFSFPCNSRRDPESTGLDQGIAGIIKQLFGAGFLDQINGHISVMIK